MHPTMNDYEKAETVLRNLVFSLQNGTITAGTMIDYLMPALSESAVKGLADDYDDMKNNLNELENKS